MDAFDVWIAFIMVQLSKQGVHLNKRIFFQSHYFAFICFCVEALQPIARNLPVLYIVCDIFQQSYRHEWYLIKKWIKLRINVNQQDFVSSLWWSWLPACFLYKLSIQLCIKKVYRVLVEWRTTSSAKVKFTDNDYETHLERILIAK